MTTHRAIAIEVPDGQALDPERFERALADSIALTERREGFSIQREHVRVERTSDAAKGVTRVECRVRIDDGRSVPT